MLGTYVHVHSSNVMKKRYEHSRRPETDAMRIERLLFQASVARRGRSAIPSPAVSCGPTAIDESDPERVASQILEDVLTSDLGAIVNCAAYLTRAVSLQYMAIPSLNVLQTSIHAVDLAPLAGRGLAVAICELMYHAGGGAIYAGPVDLQLAVGVDGSHLVVGLVANGGVHPVASASATAAMMRAIDMVSALRGQFVRVYEPARTTFAILLPYREVAATSPKVRAGRGRH